MRWTAAFFSQTGSEILNIINSTGAVPDVIITNRLRKDGTLKNSEIINRELLDRFGSRIVCIPVKPSVEDYENALNNRDGGLLLLG